MSSERPVIFVLALFAAVVPLVVVDPLQDRVVLPKLVTTAAFTGVALLGSAVLLLRAPRSGGRWSATLWMPAAGFVAVNVLALIFALDWRWSLVGEHLRYQGLATTLVYVLLFAVTALAVRTTRDARWLALGLFTGAVGAAVYALLQKAGLAWWPDPVPDRPASTLGQANAFGAYLVAVASASVFLILTASARWQRVALGAGLLAMLVALGFTVSRSAYLAGGAVVLLFGVAGARWFLPAWRGRKLRVGAGVVAATALPLVLAALAIFFIGLPQGRISVASEGNSQAVEGRLSLWRMGLEMTADRPLLGHGQDAFTVLFARYRDRPDLPGIGTDNIEPESSHNFFVDLAAGTGVLGLLAFLTLVGAVVWRAARRSLATDDVSLRLALVALTAGAVAYLAAVFFGFSEAMTTWVLWLLLGATAGLLREEPDDDPAPAAAPLAAKGAAFALAVAGVACLGWAATITAADLAAGQAESAARRGEYAAAARLAGRAVSLNPLQRSYLAQEAQAQERTSTATGDRAPGLQQAVATYGTLLQRFQPSAFDALGLATASAELAQQRGTPIEETFDLFEDAVALDPFNAALRAFVADHYQRQGFEDRALAHRFEMLCWHTDCD